ncbi:MAG: hypothetical protein JXX14_06815 [Deltaproteobacteria bacterium]|nr:hypothetical protein [Deltaproteobacteria bacterium]
MIYKTVTVCALSALFLTIGCGAPYATMQKTGLNYRDYRVGVVSISEYKPRFLESNWEVANWLERAADKTWQRKDIPLYKGPVFVDRYGAGDPRKVKNYYSELVLDHDGSLSTLTVDVTSASARERNISMDDIYQTFVDNMAAGEPWYAGKRFEKATVDKQAKITMLNSQVIRIMDFDAIIGYVDRNEFDSDAPNADMRYAIFLLRLTDVGGTNRTESLQGEKEKIPAILSVILESEPEYFNSLVDDFYSLLKQLRINGKEFDVDYVSTSDRPVAPEPCDAKMAKKEGKACPETPTRDTSGEDFVSPKGGTKKKK